MKVSKPIAIMLITLAGMILVGAITLYFVTRINDRKIDELNSEIRMYREDNIGLKAVNLVIKADKKILLDSLEIFSKKYESVKLSRRNAIIYYEKKLKDFNGANAVEHQLFFSNRYTDNN